ncbi:MAG TPA: hypothetical protein ENJ32_11345 [Crenotrichaceae bacterium]|nr:hypothetical protein [Crenotrichaceae bacterium]
MQIALLSNPDSGRSKYLDKIRKLADSDHQIKHFLAADSEQFARFVEELKHTPVDLVVINAGDGTIQALLTLIMLHLPEPPLLAILKGGTTNMTNGDVGIKGSSVSGLKRIMQWNNRQDKRIQTRIRPVLKIQWNDPCSPICGMFFGAGAIIEGQDYFHSHLRKKGLRNSIGPALSAIRILFALNRNQQTLFSPVSMQISGWEDKHALESSGEPVIQSSGSHLVALASGLERLFLGIHPFWGNNQGAWHFTAAQHQPAGYSLLRLLPLFRGKAASDVAQNQGFISAKLDHLEMHLNGEFTVDGERYATRADSPLITISVAGYARFLQL